MLESVAIGLAASVLFTIAAGLRRWPWRWCAVAGFGMGLFLATLRFSGLEPRADTGTLIGLGALGGSIMTVGFERGERDRRARSAAILGPTRLDDPLVDRRAPVASLSARVRRPRGLPCHRMPRRRSAPHRPGPAIATISA